ncbi:leucyl/phenylalanyl-tRNA--protein transferase [Aquirufa sp. OSTEICH-129V]|uniref:Leucyl/phenylalanyl-tRNA--protein transferase n=1 Tax=Aquirufa avitistagni TaxID=3104728 RepID=A0ABW6DDY8_9BACT
MENTNSLSTDQLIYAYASGVFPMADAETGEINWYRPDPRAIIPIDTYQPSRSLKPILNKGIFEIKVDQQFRRVMEFCAEPRPYEPETWISTELIDVYTELHRMGFAHSVEAYVEGELVGGLYGVHIGAAFFGESMFTRASNASKVCFHYLIELLRKNNFELLDSQFMNDNVKRYGAIEISRTAYEKRLAKAINRSCNFVF